MDQRVGDWMQTYPTGAQFWPLDPRPEEVHIEDIAHALSLICRFGGHCRDFYSVAQHSVLVSQICHPEDALAGLLHDATEAYMGDMIRPLKYGSFGAVYRYHEEQLRLVIYKRFGVPGKELPASVIHADRVALWTEKSDLLTDPPAPWGLPQSGPVVEALPETTTTWSCAYSKLRFLSRFHSLTEK